MLARIQQALVLLLAAAAAGWWYWCFRHGHALWSLAMPAVIVAGYLATLACEFTWMLSTYERGDVLRPRLGQIFRAWITEATIGPAVFLWWQPFRSRVIPDRLTPRPCGRRGMVFVHGFFCNRGVWTRWLRRTDRNFVAVDLEPAFGSIDRYGDAIGQAVDRITQSTGMTPIVVAHSMGGLAVRAWLASDGQADKVHRVVTIATPHAGTRAARYAGSRNGAQMAEGSAWLAELAAREDPKVRPRFVCFWGHCDNIVFPVRSAMLDGADNRHLTATPHVRMVFHRDIFAAVMALADDDAVPSH